MILNGKLFIEFEVTAWKASGVRWERSFTIDIYVIYIGKKF